MAQYTLSNGSTTGGGTQQATGSAYSLPILGLNSSTSVPRRGKVFDLLIGTDGTPADNFIEWDVSRITTSSTSTLLAGFPLDPADAASASVSTVNSTAAPTIGTPGLWYVGINQRASYRWIASPGSEIVWPATASNGLALRGRSASYTGTLTGTWMWIE